MVTRSQAGPARGFALIVVLLMVVAVSLAATAAVQRPQTAMQREREAQLRFAGDQYRRALASYYGAVPQAKQYPLRLEDLLEDRRFPVPRRHLRRLYPDPMTGRADWELLLQDGRIVGLHSRSRAPTLRQTDVATAPQTYAEWRFVAAAIATGKLTAIAPQPPSLQPPSLQPPSLQAPPLQAAPPAPPPLSEAPPAPPPEPQPEDQLSCSARYSAALYACSAPELAAQERTNCRVQAGRQFRECKRTERGG